MLASDNDTGDLVTGYAIVGGADQGLFTIDSGSGVLTFNAAPNFEAPSDTNTDGRYLVTVQATSGTGVSTTITDLAEGTSYQVQVRATNNDGAGDWSPSGSGSTDANPAGVRVSETALTVTEQDTTGDSYTVVLDTEPTHGVTVTVGGHSGTDVSLSASTLTFTTSNWDRSQTVTVTEQDTTGDSYTVVLDTEPTHEVTVTVGGHSGTDVSLSASTLTFTPSNWDRAQTVTVTALNDDDTANDAVTLTHTAASTDGNYSGITIAGVSVTVTDNDTTTPAVTLVLSGDSIGENGGVSTVTATVAPASAAAFTVTVAAAAVSPAVAADFRLSANRVLSFAENATESTGSVTITGVDDDVDAADKTVTVSGTRARM